MPAYNFQGQFVPYIEDESKPHTVRADRKDGKVPKPGEILYLYTGMRTKKCRKIGEAICWATQRIEITETGIYMGAYSEEHYASGIGLGGPYWPLLPETADKFSWSDGFRPVGSTVVNPSGAFDLLLQFFKQTHDLPFQGVVICWKDFKATPK